MAGWKDASDPIMAIGAKSGTWTLDELNGRIALVVDAPVGIGPAIARRLGARGAWVAVNFRRDLEGAKRLVDAIRSAGGRATLVPGDAADPAQAWAVVERIDLQWGPVDLVVVSTCLEKESRIQNPESRNDQDETHQTSNSIEAVGNLTTAALPALRRSELRRIVVVGADDSLSAAVAMARDRVGDAEIEVRAVLARPGDAAEDVAEVVIEACTNEKRKRKNERVLCG
jgi:NADP-dependent 3-hydroxy acid dehydrogenase YdfG